ATLTAARPAHADWLEDAGWGSLTVLTNLVYMPAKVTYALLGGLTGGFAYALTAGDLKTAETVWVTTMGGTYVVTPHMLQGDDPSPRHAAEVEGVAADDPDRAGAFALAAAAEALAGARLDLASDDPTRVGVALGTTLGGMLLFEGWEEAVASATPPPAGLDAIPYYGPAVRLARRFGCRGPVATPQLACASATHAIALAADW